MTKRSISIIQVTSSLNPGGAERVAVNLANALAGLDYASHICSTRGGSGLLTELHPSVKMLSLGRTGRFDVGAFARFVRYVRENDIRIIHSHSTSLFIAAAVNWLCPGTRLLWHDHYGAYATVRRPVWLYRLFTARLDGVLAVNTDLAAWARERLRVPCDRVWYIPNFVAEQHGQVEVPDLPGEPGYRVVCVANLRPQKDHLNLLRAMEGVVEHVPQAHLILLGSSNEDDYSRAVLSAATSGRLAGRVTWLGSRDDVRSILRGCDVGVLSSASEGLPLSLLEYGMAGLASVATDVGQCAEVLRQGEAGIVVPPSSPHALEGAVVGLLKSRNQRRDLGARLLQHVRQHHGHERAISGVETIYRSICSNEGG